MKKRVPKWIQKRAAEMYDELLANKQEVVLIPSQDPDCAMRGGMIRAVQSAPPRWFSEFAGQWMRNSVRQPRLRPNFIKREWTLCGLRRLMKGDDKSVYAQRLRRFIEDELEHDVPF